MQYFAQDEANRLDPTKTVYETMESDSPVGMVPMIRNILGGFLFSGDDIYKRAGVLSGGERTRLAVARMLLRPANTLLLDEPTNHLDLDSKDVLLEALEDFGGTLIFVSHDRYFVDRLATKIIEVGHGSIEVYPGTYEQFLWSKAQRAAAADAAAPAEPPSRQAAQRRHQAAERLPTASPATAAANRPSLQPPSRPAPPPDAQSYEDKKKGDAEARQARGDRGRATAALADLEARIAEREQAIKDLEAQMAAPGFYDDRDAGRRRRQPAPALMWEVGDLMNQWEALQSRNLPTSN